MADSILFTSFESWVIAEADARRLPMPLLSRLFSVATFSNAGTAVIAGMVGHFAVEVVPHATHNKFTSAFDVGVVVLLIAAALAATQWGERCIGQGSGSRVGVKGRGRGSGSWVGFGATPSAGTQAPVPTLPATYPASHAHRASWIYRQVWRPAQHSE